MSRTNFDTLLEAGCHFGHLKRKWNPAMAPYIFICLLYTSGRYRGKTDVLAAYFSEFALIKYRVKVEIPPVHFCGCLNSRISMGGNHLQFFLYLFTYIQSLYKLSLIHI